MACVLVGVCFLNLWPIKFPTPVYTSHLPSYTAPLLCMLPGIKTLNRGEEEVKKFPTSAFSHALTKTKGSTSKKLVYTFIMCGGKGAFEFT